MNQRRLALVIGVVIAGAVAAAAVVILLHAGPMPRSPRTTYVAAVVLHSGLTEVLVPGGEFLMGSARGEPDETPHKVAVSPFFMDACEVTQESFEKLMGRNPSRWQEPKAPVDQIRWKDAAAYCNARSRLEHLEPAYDETTWQCNFEATGYRLPTEAEWEYACRAGETSEYASGDSPADLPRYAWFKENAARRPQPVGTRQPNAWGLHDMQGNVWEWCNDFYQEDYYRASPEKDPRGPPSAETRVLRGGCWNSPAAKCRASYRLDENPGFTDACFGRDISGFVGFRCVRRPAPAE